MGHSSPLDIECRVSLELSLLQVEQVDMQKVRQQISLHS